jgi:hypothetical protein
MIEGAYPNDTTSNYHHLCACFHNHISENIYRSVTASPCWPSRNCDSKLPASAIASGPATLDLSSFLRQPWTVVEIRKNDHTRKMAGNFYGPENNPTGVANYLAQTWRITNE